MKLKYTLASLLLMSICQPAMGNGFIKIHAPYKESFSCTEHWDGQFKSLGDALGTDCVIQKLVDVEGRVFQRTFRNQGFENTDWFGFGKDVLAPCDCVVEAIHINEATNKPGMMTPGRASSITFRNKDNTRVLLAHVQEIRVKEGQAVKAGEVVAKVGNNGYSRNPHIHIAAWSEDETPLQIQFDQTTLGIKTRQELAK
jgi:murein DD-endopeptidase MepM/ murein hydrolase activator NlpD